MIAHNILAAYYVCHLFVGKNKALQDLKLNYVQ